LRKEVLNCVSYLLVHCYCRIPELPISIYFNPELKSLNVSHNFLERLPHAAPGDTTSLSQQDYMDLLKTKGAPVLGTNIRNQSLFKIEAL